MWKTLVDRLLGGLVVTGRLTIKYPDGDSRDYGPDTSPHETLTLHDPAILRQIVLNPELAMGEGYMQARITIEDDRLEEVLKLLVHNRMAGQMPLWVRGLDRALYHARLFLQRNAPAAARRNVAHHYDISDDLYRLFLDEDMQYSCAYFERPGMSLEDAQEAKKHHIARKLLLEPGMRVLDIGCGWGGMALTLARDYGVHVTGVTLSENQLATARRRAQEAGLSDRAQFELRDYRRIDGSFDRIVSIGMFEHVGVPNYAAYFSKIDSLLAPEGVALIHTIGRSAPPMAHSPWIHKYIFPGGYVPSLSEIAPALEGSGLWQSDIEMLRLHYAMTLRAWRDRFDAAQADIRAMYDETFVRMFRYYLTACIIGFEDQHQLVYQLQLAKTLAAVPLTRNYLYPNKAASWKQAAE
ncbi:class I SAM-dependent methyltransferase [Aliishimia ponticola]|uniref:Class I SAM-dependent methyltransferase n=1 Tax=Aliishimia ponticola TaxID=2499833 RepID=A0A4S4NLM9_9RHOB|nr:cyclopropane-fatty-acyl-phospholipid synthase family protein [Aliishimia ponticola]THH37080.1 class I SAM-dependent methyltransferase [Aliishimia ponticola]